MKVLKYRRPLYEAFDFDEDDNEYSSIKEDINKAKTFNNIKNYLHNILKSSYDLVKCCYSNEKIFSDCYEPIQENLVEIKLKDGYTISLNSIPYFGIIHIKKDGISLCWIENVSITKYLSKIYNFSEIELLKIFSFYDEFLENSKIFFKDLNSENSLDRILYDKSNRQKLNQIDFSWLVYLNDIIESLTKK